MEIMLLLLAARQRIVVFVMDHYLGLHIILFRCTLFSFAYVPLTFFLQIHL